MDIVRKEYYSLSAETQTIELLSLLKEVRNQVGKDEFRKLLIGLGADESFSKMLNEILGHFQYMDSRFNPRFQSILSIIGNNVHRRGTFLDAINTFKPGKRGKKGGGLKEFKTEISIEYNHKLKMLREFARLYLIDPEEPISREKVKRHSELNSQIPPHIQNSLHDVNLSDLAIQWMLEYYPCSEASLKQIIYDKSTSHKNRP